jgi:ABC-type antimicrobial peptide transport system permease subunit
MMPLLLSYGIRSLFARRLTMGLTVMGLSLVVFVFTAALMLAHGLERTLVTTGAPENVIILRKGANTEIASGIYRDQARLLATQPVVAADQAGRPLALSELVVLMTLQRPDQSRPANVVVRGTNPDALAIRSQVSIARGRSWQPGTTDIVVGRQIADRFPQAGLNGRLRFAKQEWTVVGVFEANGSGFESEIWGDADALMAAYGRDSYSSSTLRLQSPELLATLRMAIETDPRLSLQVKPEQSYYAEKSGMMGMFIRLLGLVLTFIFSIGAVLGAAMTMYGTVSQRTAEIGTLKALGFTPRHILTVFTLEASSIGAVAGGLGILAASLLQSVTISTINWGTFSELAFGFVLSPRIASWAFLFAVTMGLLGGLLPAVRAARLPVLAALATR